MSANSQREPGNNEITQTTYAHTSCLVTKKAQALAERRLRQLQQMQLDPKFSTPLKQHQ